MHRLSALLIGLACITAGAGAETIPATQCTSLSKDAVTLPGDLHGRAGVLVIGFSRDSQDAVRGWSRRLAADYGQSSTVTFYEIAMLGEVPRILRGVVVRAMKKDIPERAQNRFLTVTGDQAGWRKVAHFARPEDAYVLVIDPTGAVQWHSTGAPTNAAYAELRRHLP